MLMDVAGQQMHKTKSVSATHVCVSVKVTATYSTPQVEVLVVFGQQC